MLGGFLTYEKITGGESTFFSPEETVLIETEYYTLAIESDYRYISKNSFQMYSGLGLGLLITNGEEDFSPITFNITALGFRVGRTIAAFAELGFGYKGIVNIGASYQF